jgi:hypothetical protein
LVSEIPGRHKTGPYRVVVLARAGGEGVMPVVCYSVSASSSLA